MNLAVALAALLAAALPAPDPGRRVHDFAGILAPDDVPHLDQLARNVEQRTTAQLSIVTVASLDGLTVDDYAHQLFNRWGIGQKETNNGVLLLVAPTERRMRIEVGYGLEPLLTDALCGEIRDEQIIPRFKANDYSGGVRAGAERIADILLADPAAARGDPNSAPHLARAAGRRATTATALAGGGAISLIVLAIAMKWHRLYSTVTFLAISLIGLGALAAAIVFHLRAPQEGRRAGILGGVGVATAAGWAYNLARYRRFGPHGCSKCGTQLELLSDQADDPKLSAVQRLEEQIGSVDYDVWVCPACLHTDTERYLKPFSGFGQCPKCSAQTFKKDPRVIETKATTARTGLAYVDARCVSCNYKTRERIILPVIVENDSSNWSSGSGFSGGGGGGGGGGYGGGSSGGGGASGGW